MEKAFKTEALVLTKKNWREQDLLFSFFTKEFGRIEAVVVGARKAKSKLVGPLSSLGLCEMVFVKGKVFNKVTHTYLLRSWEVKTIEQYYALSTIKEMVNRFVPIGSPNMQLWKLITWFSQEISLLPQVETQKLLLNIFIVRILSLLGYELKIDECVQCGQEIKQVRRFSFHNKGFVCQNCRGGEMNISQKIFETIKKIQQVDSIREISINQTANKELFNFLKKYAQYFFEKQIKSLDLV